MIEQIKVNKVLRAIGFCYEYTTDIVKTNEESYSFSTNDGLKIIVSKYNCLREMDSIGVFRDNKCIVSIRKTDEAIGYDNGIDKCILHLDTNKVTFTNDELVSITEDIKNILLK